MLPNTIEGYLSSGDLQRHASRYDWTVRASTERPSLFMVSMPAKDASLYHLRIDWSDYPEAPSVIFCTKDFDVADPRAWPDGESTLFEWIKVPPNCFICCPFTKEGFAHHADWRTMANPRWQTGVSTIVDTLLFIQNRLLWGPHYRSRRSA